MRTKTDKKHLVTAEEYRFRLRLVRKFADGFGAGDGYDARKIKKLSSAKKREINRYYESIQPFLSRDNYIYRPRNKSHLARIKEENETSGLKKIKVGFINTPTEYSEAGEKVIVKPDISFTGKEKRIKIKFGNKSRVSYLFDDYLSRENQAEDGAIADLVNEIVDQTEHKFYTVICGEYELGKKIPKFIRGETLADEIHKLQSRYESDSFDPDDTSSHYWGNWLRGVRGYSFNNVGDIKNYANAVREYNNKKENINKQINRVKKQIESIEITIHKYKRKKKITEKRRNAEISKRENLIREKRKAIGQLMLERANLLKR